MIRSIFLSLFIFPLLVFAQNGSFSVGARHSALGGASSTLTDQWSLFNNVAGIGHIQKDHAFISYQNRFQIKEFQVISTGYVRRFKKMGMGVGFYRFGDMHFSEQRINAGIGHKLDRVSLGLSVDYLQYNISTVGTRGVIILEFGGITEINKEIQLGAHIFNLNQASLNSTDKTKIPTVMKAGISYRLSQDFALFLETEKEIDFIETIKIGIEHQLSEGIILRTGLNTAPFKGSFGFGFYSDILHFDYAFSNDSNLGGTHEISFSYKPKRR